MERYVITTHRLHGLHICAQGGYVTTTYPKIQLMKDDALMYVNEIIGLIVS